MHESAEHAALVELFRHHPELAALLVERVGKVELPVGYTARVGDPAQKPAALAPDVVIELWDASGVRALTIIVEVQRSIEEEKLFTWPAYQWLERLRRRCDCIVLVIATRREVARWADRAIHSGPGSVTRVIVLGPEDVPRITDLAEARANPALAVLSAGIHGKGPEGTRVVRAAFTAIHALRPADTRQYNHLVFRSLSADAIAQILEDIMQETQGNQEEDPFAGWKEYLARVTAKQEARAEVRARANVLLRQLDARGIALDGEARARVLACEDVEQLDAWLDRVLTATCAADLFER